jgi:lysyl-tRNA synthetase class 1
MNTPDQSQTYHWVDRVTASILEWKKQQKLDHLHVDDMKTPSGRVHTGALRGVLIHDIVANALRKHDPRLRSTYVFNDMDPMDSLPGYLDKTVYEKHMGEPLYKIPVPLLEKSGIDLRRATPEEKKELEEAQNFAELYAVDFLYAFKKLGATQDIVWSHELYESGKMDSIIRFVLDHVDEVKKVYEEVAEYKLPTNWYPFQVICPECGKVGTTLTTGWDGQLVSFECQPNKVKWAQGCGHTGKVSPFGGNGKLLWKVDWPAHWQVMGVNVEGAGKDHTSAGGSRDMANAMLRRIFKNVVPFDIPYEWILIRGAKMSSSKGVGTSAREFVELFPQEVGRFLFVSRNYSQVIDFDPQTMAIPDLFDEFDAAATSFWTNDEESKKNARSFELSFIESVPQQYFLPRFRDVAVWMQYPEINLSEKFAEIKGAPLNEVELNELNRRKQYAQIWLDRYAAEEFQFRPKTQLPDSAKKLSEEQKEFLKTAIDLSESQDWKGKELELQTQLYQSAKSSIGTKLAFASIYQAFLGKNHGPRAAWLLVSMDKELKEQRLQDLQGKNSSYTHIYETAKMPDLISISDEVRQKYPSITMGFAILKGVQIKEQDPALEKERENFLQSFSTLTNEQISSYPEVLSYRKMYKEMGIDWHSRRPSPEALLRRLAQGKGIYSVNTCVDAYNMAVIKNRVSVGAFDLKNVQLPTQLQIAKGNEEILLLGDNTPTTLKPGEVSYFDQNGPYNLDFNYRDAQRTKVTTETTDLLINVEGVYDITREQVETTLKETLEVIQKYCGGTIEHTFIVG